MSLPALLEKEPSRELFAANGVEPILTEARKWAAEIEADPQTPKGRAHLKSEAYALSKVKTKIDKYGKELVSDLKAQVAVIDGERKKLRDGLTELQEEIKKPALEWEEADNARREKNQQRIAEIKAITPGKDSDSRALESLLEQLLKLAEYPFCPEYIDEAEQAAFTKAEELRTHFTFARKNEELQAEQKRLEQQRLIIEERERKAKQAEERQKEEERRREQERREAEEKAAREAEQARAEAERRIREAEERAKAAEEQAARAQEEAENRAREAEAAAQRAAEEAERRKREEAERLRKEQAEAAARAAEERRRKEAAERQAAQRNAEAADMLITFGVPEDKAEAVILAIRQDKIPFVVWRD